MKQVLKTICSYEDNSICDYMTKIKIILEDEVLKLECTTLTNMWEGCKEDIYEPFNDKVCELKEANEGSTGCSGNMKTYGFIITEEMFDAVEVGINLTAATKNFRVTTVNDQVLFDLSYNVAFNMESWE